MNKNEKINILKTYANYKPTIYQALEKLNYKYGIEIGVRLGNNLENLSKNKLFQEGVLIGLDAWSEDPNAPEINDENFSQYELDNQYNYCISRFKQFNHMQLIKSRSVDGCKLFNDEYFDFIYIDAAHDYDSVKNDLIHWWGKLKIGGILSGHDYFPDKRIWRGKEVGVYQAVNEFAIEKNTEVHHVTDTNLEGGPNVACNSFFIIK
jgi:hypothetical protein